MRFRWLAALATIFLTGGLASAQPKDAGPTIELRLRSVNDLLDRFEYVAGLAGKGDDAKNARQFLQAITVEGKGIQGIDPKKPVGAYATLVKEVESSPFVILVPIADQDQFLAALKTHLDVTPEKNDDGTLKAAIPIVNELHLRFASGYLYVSPKAKDLDPKAMPKPEAYFAKDDGSAASLVVHIDRIPAELRTFVLGQFELGVNEERKKNAEKESAAEKRLKNLLFDHVVGGAKALAEDGKDLGVRLFIDLKTEELSAEVTLTAKPGSGLAKNFAALEWRKSLSAGIVASASGPVARGSVKLAVADGMKKEYTAAIDAILAEVVKKAGPGEQPVVQQLVDAVGPTLKAGELDAAAALTGPDAKGHYQLLAAAGVTDGKKVEKFAKDVSAMVAGAADFAFDVDKVGDYRLHRIDVNAADEKFEKLFGTKSIWLAVSDKQVAVSIEPEGKTIRKALEAKPAAAPVAAIDASAAKLLPLIRPDLKPDELKALLKDAFGDGGPDGKDRATLLITGGQQLTAKVRISGKAVRLSAGLDLLKGK
jgi:hypothetical protein